MRLPGLTGKQLEIAVDLVPKVSKIGVLFNVSNPSNAIQWREAESASATLGISVAPAEVRGADDVGPAFQTFLRDGISIVIVLLDAMFLTARRQIAAFRVGVAACPPYLCHCPISLIQVLHRHRTGWYCW
jgi:ABC-type uncharacterized transport system substrate-binding protein